MDSLTLCNYENRHRENAKKNFFYFFFQTEHGFVQHCQRIHGYEPSEIHGIKLKEKNYMCEECSKCFRAQHNLERHVDGVHKGIKLRRHSKLFFQRDCPHCEKTFYKRSRFEKRN